MRTHRNILHDPQVYPDPHEFNPWRWLIDTADGPKLNPGIPDPDVTFGFGRRICPGRQFALNPLFITVSNVLTCFDIRPLDEHGQPADRVKEDTISGFVIYPNPFNISITPRSPHLERLIKDITV